MKAMENPLTGIAIVLGVFLVAALIAAAGRVPEQPRSSLIYILTTPVPTRPLPTADTRELEALRARVAELEAQKGTVKMAVPSPEGAQPVYQVLTHPTQPTPYTAHTTAGDIVVPPDATKVPEGATYTGPFLAPVVTPPTGLRVCDGFGDWCDYSAEYAASPAYHKAGP